LVDIPSNTAITQYEGLLITKAHADAVRNSYGGKQKAGHFCTTSVRCMVINGYSVESHQPNQQHSRPTLSGVPLHIDSPQWKGCGGASICNHSIDPNATLHRDPTGDGYGVFAVSLRQINKGEFIHVDYTNRFLNSSKGNI
jgi:hypothetical protein